MATIFDTFRDTAVTLFATFGAPATITSTGAPTRDKIAGTVTPGAEVTTSCLAALGQRRLVAVNGAVTVQSIARVNAPIADGNRLTVGTKSFIASDIEEVNPDGQTPMVWVAVLK